MRVGRKLGHTKPNLVYSAKGLCHKNRAVFDLVAVTSRPNTDAPSIDDCTSPLPALSSPMFIYGHNKQPIFMKHVVYEINILNTCLRYVRQQRTNKTRVLLKCGNDAFQTSENHTKIKRHRDLILCVNVII